MEFVIGSDHGGFDLKEELKQYLLSKDIKVIDIGTYSKESVDYPDIAKKLSKTVLEKEILGLLICGTGIGISIAANKQLGIRAALCSESFSAKMSRKHNNANVLVLGGRTTGYELAKDILDSFLYTDFEKGRHLRRVNKIEKTEESL